MVIDPTDLGATIVVAQALCLTIFNLSSTQITCLFTDGNKASVCGQRQPHSCLALLSLLDISAASPLFGADGSVAALTVSAKN